MWSAASRAAAAKAQTWTSSHGGKGDKAGSSRCRQRPGAEGGVVAAASELFVVGLVVYLYRARGGRGMRPWRRRTRAGGGAAW